MMPYIDEIQKHSSYVEEFLGISHRPRISEKQFSDAYNVNNDEYPLLATRKPRLLKRDYGEVILSAIEVDGNDAYLYRSNDRVWFEYITDSGAHKCELGPYSNERYHLVKMGAQIVAFPNLYVYNTITKEGKVFGSDMTLGVGTEIDLYVKTADNGFVEVVTEATKDAPCYLLHMVEELPQVLYYDGTTTKPVDSTYVFLKITNPMIFGSMQVDCMKVSESLDDVLGFGQILFPSIIIDGAEIHDGYAYVRGIASVLDFKILTETRIAFTARDADDNYKEYEKETAGAYVSLNLNYKPIDFVVESQNRLWACKYNGAVNELYASGLGRYDDWTSNDAADSAWTASVGTPGAFTGACVVANNPIFFKEEYMHKIYPSSIGAHQIVQSDIRGVADGCAKSLIRVGDYIYYKSRGAVMRFDGVAATDISYEIDAAQYSNAIAGAHNDKYVMYCERKANSAVAAPYLFVYDTRYGTWQRESLDFPKLTLMAESCGRLTLHYLDQKDETVIFFYENEDGNGDTKIPYMFESGDIGYSDMVKKYLVRLDMRVKLDFGASFNVWIQYDGDGNWHQITRLRGMLPAPRIETVNVMPHRCDHFRLKVTGIGKMRLYSFRKIYESEDE